MLNLIGMTVLGRIISLIRRGRFDIPKKSIHGPDYIVDKVIESTTQLGTV